MREYVKNEGKKAASVQRSEGLGEMNAEQLADTTINAEKSTLLQVRLEDASKREEIFSTLMGEDVEALRQKIHRGRRPRCEEPRRLARFTQPQRAS